MHVLYVGDVKSVGIATPKGKPTSLTHELVPHSVALPAEQQRIEAAGGQVRRWKLDNVGEVGPIACWYGPGHKKRGTQAPGLPVSRAIGLTDYADCGIITKPDVFCLEVDSAAAPNCFIVGSEGVWNRLSTDEMREIVQKHSSKMCAKRICTDLVRAATKKMEEDWQGHNTTCAVVVFQAAN